MHWLQEVRRAVSYWREFLAIEGQAVNGDALRLIEAIPGLEVEWCEGQRELMLNHTTGEGWVLVDPQLQGARREMILLEEAAHFLLHHLAPPAPGLRNLFISNGKAETPAAAFVTLWLAAGIDGSSDDDLIYGGMEPKRLAHLRQLQILG